MSHIEPLNDKRRFRQGWVPVFNVKRVFHASGAVETLGYFQTREEPIGGGRPRSPRRSNEELLDACQDRDERSTRRTRKSFRYLMHSLCPDRMLTLTYRENMQDYDTAALDFDRFVRWLRREYPNIVLVAVAEKQHRGAWHWHIALRQYVNIVNVRKRWFHGQVNIRRKTFQASHGRAASYLAKYLSKAVEMVGRSAYKVLNRKLLTKPTITKYRLFLKGPDGSNNLWTLLASAFSHLADCSYCKDGIFWRLDYGSSESLYYRSSEVRACFGHQGGL